MHYLFIILGIFSKKSVCRQQFGSSRFAVKYLNNIKTHSSYAFFCIKICIFASTFNKTKLILSTIFTLNIEGR